MALSIRLCNPTPDLIDFEWNKGVYITIEPDSYFDLSSEQYDDFRGGKPGSEEVTILMESTGMFLRDTDLDYDVQALTALRSCYKAKNGQFKESVERLKAMRAGAGIKEDVETFTENLRSLGLLQLKDRADKLASRITFFEKVVDEKADSLSRTNNLNPELTLFLHEGAPKEFPSKAAKALFKQENPKLVAGDPAEQVESDASSAG